MLNKEDSMVIMSQLSREAEIQHQAKMNILVEQQEYNLFNTLKPTIAMDGDQWCVSLGANPMEGVQGFGDTLYHAVLDFNKAFDAKINVT